MLQPAVLLLLPQPSSNKRAVTAPHNTRPTPSTSQEHGTGRVCTAGLPGDPSHHGNASRLRSAPSVSTHTAYATNKSLSRTPVPAASSKHLHHPLCQRLTLVSVSTSPVLLPTRSSTEQLQAASHGWEAAAVSDRTDASHIPRERSAGAEYCEGKRQLAGLGSDTRRRDCQFTVPPGFYKCPHQPHTRYLRGS